MSPLCSFTNHTTPDLVFNFFMMKQPEMKSNGSAYLLLKPFQRRADAPRGLSGINTNTTMPGEREREKAK